MGRFLRRVGLALASFVIVALAMLTAASVLQAQREAEGVAPPASGSPVSAGDAEIFVQRFGSPDRPAVVIVPGTAAWSGLWASAAQDIAQAGFYVVAVDLPPFGFSSRPLSANYSRAAQAERLAALIDTMRLIRPIVLAHSFGAGAAVELALRHRDKLGGLMLVDGALALPAENGPPDSDPAWLSAALHFPLVARAAVDGVLINPWLTRRLLAGLLARREAATDARVSALQGPYRRPGTSEAYALWLPSLLLHDGGALSADPSAYSHIGMPVALIWGAADSVTPIAQGERLRTLIPGATLDALPGLGHIPHIEDESAFVSAAVRRLRAMPQTK